MRELLWEILQYTQETKLWSPVNAEFLTILGKAPANKIVGKKWEKATRGKSQYQKGCLIFLAAT